MLEDAFKRVLADGVTAVLKPRGFKKKRGNYTRQLPGLVWTVQVQRSQWNDAEHVSFTLNCGVYVAGVAPLMWGKPDPMNPETFSVGGRIGALENTDGVDLWWELRADDVEATMQHAVNDICARLELHVLPFLDRFQAPSDVLNALEALHPQLKMPSDERHQAVLEAIVLSPAAALRTLRAGANTISDRLSDDVRGAISSHYEQIAKRISRL